MDRLASDRMFVAVMETGSFAAAARKLGTSSGQASKLVSALETALGTRLLNRTTRALAPTELGQTYYDQVRGILADLDALDESLKDAGATPRGRLRLTAPVTFGALRLVTGLNRFAALYPEIELDVSFTDRIVNLVEEGFDAAIRIGRPADSSMIARKLGESFILAVASDAYLARRGTPGHPDDLTQHDCIMDTNARDYLTWRYPGGAVTLRGRLRYSSAFACLDAAEQGLGIARVPDFIAREALAAGRVRRILTEFEGDPMTVQAVFPPGRYLSPKVRLLVDYLAAMAPED